MGNFVLVLCRVWAQSFIEAAEAKGLLFFFHVLFGFKINAANIVCN